MIRIALSKVKLAKDKVGAAPKSSRAALAQAEVATALKSHVAALEAHMMGPPGVPAPVGDELVEALFDRVPDTGPVAERGPDKFVMRAYTIVDDAPLDPEAQHALDVLRETIAG
jgi:hypothetical protein